MTGLLLKSLTIVALLALFYQDLRSRSVYWALLPLLAGLFITARCLAGEPISSILQSTAVNLAFIFLQLSLVTLYFSLKAGRPINITSGLLGWGDVLFLFSTAFLLPVLLFVIFYLASLVLVLIGWSIFLWARFTQTRAGISGGTYMTKKTIAETVTANAALLESATLETATLRAPATILTTGTKKTITAESAAPTIPLAGLQALLLAAALLVTWLFPQSAIVKLTRELQTFMLWS